LKEAALCLTERLDDRKDSMGMVVKRIFMVLTVNGTSLGHFPDGETTKKIIWCQELAVSAFILCQ
jgi:hypothetical protein